MRIPLWAVAGLLLALSPTHSRAATKTMSFTLANPIDNGAYNWPRTVLGYPVRFGAGEARSVWLTDDAGQPVPFQITDAVYENGCLRSGVVRFTTDLPRNAKRCFTLSYSDAQVKRADAKPATPVTVKKLADGNLAIDNGRMTVVIPALGDHAADQVSGPILKVGYGGKLYGSSSLHIDKAVKAWKVTEVERGDLVSAYRVAYTFADGAGYTVTIRASAEMPFIDFIEDGTGIGASTEQYWVFDFSDMKPGERFNQFAGDIANATRWEPVGDGLRAGTGEWPFRLSPFYPKDNRFRHAMIGVKNDADVVGLSVRHNEAWISDRYPIWAFDRYSGAFFFTNGDRVTARFPMANGCQWMAFTAYPAEQGFKPLLANTVWHEILDLDKVKDQVLVWDEPTTGHQPVFAAGTNPITTGAGLQDSIEGKKRGFTGWVGEGFTNGGGAKNPSQADRDLKGTIRGLDAGLPQLGDAERAKVLSSAAVMAYLHAGDSYYPDQAMLGGHPNFMGDAKTPPGVFAAVLPNHPDANLWRDHSERAMQMLLRYHTRPTVNTWQAKGGRWTENPSCYLRHCLTAWSDCFAAMRYHGDGRNIFAKPHADELGEYMINLPSAPYNGVRMIVQQGAHSGDICTPGEPYRVVGLALRDYAPLIAENLIWESRIGETGEPENIANVLGTKEALAAMRDGTEPLLESAKFTGYGLIMRRDVGTPNEVYLNVQQIDAGPNYRWGRAGDGGNGCLYFYAGGKRYTAHGGEDVGDASKTDTEATTSFGVWRDKSSGISRFKAAGQREPDRQDREGMFYSVGLRELTEPFYAFNTAQYARLLANPAYAGPDYRARSVMLVGGDYFIVHDEITNPQAEGRFSWFTGEKDDLPIIEQMKPGASPVARTTPGNEKKKTPGYKGVVYTGNGDFLTLVTHKPGLTGKATTFGAEVTTPTGRDLVFKALNRISYSQGGVSFQGTAGLVRQPKNGPAELAIFGAGTVSANGVALTTTGDGGASATLIKAGELRGETFAQAGGTLQVSAAGNGKLYLDGTAVEGNTLTITPGKHIWQLTAGAPIPSRPSIVRTANGKGEYTIYWTPVAGATAYRIEGDRGGKWATLAQNATGDHMPIKLAEPGKLHIRVIAVNASNESAPSAAYPLYAGTEPSRAPDGLRVDLYAKPARVYWGEVLGATEYRLERRVRGEKDWKTVFTGIATSYADPDLANNPKGVVYEYRIGAYNGNGGTVNPLVRSSDPQAYVNIDPMPGERFRRQTETFESYGDAYDAWREAYNQVLPSYPD